MSVRKIIRNHRISHSTLYKILQNEGVSERRSEMKRCSRVEKECNKILENKGVSERKVRRRKPYDPQQIIQEYTKTDINIYILASYYNISYVMVYRVLKQNGVPTRKDPNRYTNDMRRLSPLIDNILQDYYDDKFIMKSLFDKYNTTEYVFLKILKNHRPEHSFKRSKGYKIHRIIEDENGNCVVEYHHHYIIFAKTSVNIQPYIHDEDDNSNKCINMSSR